MLRTDYYTSLHTRRQFPDRPSRHAPITSGKEVRNLNKSVGWESAFHRHQCIPFVRLRVIQLPRRLKYRRDGLAARCFVRVLQADVLAGHRCADVASR